MRTKQLLAAAGAAAAMVAVSGCATTGTPNKVEQLQAQNQRMQAQLSQSQQTIARLRHQNAQGQQMQVASAGATLPPQAEPGTCWTRVYIPPKYKTSTERVLQKEASTEVEIQPAQYKWVQKRVKVKEASKVSTVVPAKFATRTERVMVQPAHTVWKPGHGAIERVDPKTGEIMCLVRVPPKYKTVTKRVMVQEPQVVTKTIPAEYKTIRVKKMVQPPQKITHKVPAQYGMVTKRKLVRAGKVEWRQIVCKTNATHELVASIQRALQQAGFDPGPIDGIIGPRTLNAVARYQHAHGLPQGAITIKTVHSLGVDTPHA